SRGAAGTGGGGGAAAGTGGGGGTAPPGPSVLMRSYDLARTGTNLAETALAPPAITAGGFGKLFCRPVDDEIYGQLLYASQLNMGAAGKHNVVFAVTMNDSIYAFDAAAGPAAPLWQKSFLGSGITAVPTPDLNGTFGNGCATYKDISHLVGITGTPAVDPAHNTIYLVARTKESGNYFQRL